MDPQLIRSIDPMDLNSSCAIDNKLNVTPMDNFVVNGPLLDHQLINSIDPIDSMDLGLLTTKKLLHQLTNGSINKQWINLLETFAINFQWIMSIDNSGAVSNRSICLW